MNEQTNELIICKECGHHEAYHFDSCAHMNNDGEVCFCEVNADEVVKTAFADLRAEIARLLSIVEGQAQTITQLRTCLEDINGWLKRTGRTGTAHQTYADEILASTAPSKDGQG